MTDHDKRPSVQFDNLNLLGKTVFLTGAAIRTTASIFDAVLEHAADLYLEAERAFRQELDEGVEDAKILEERIEDRRRKK